MGRGRMKRRILILAGVFITAPAVYAFQDSDLDGVEDSKDQCPNTPILELVDARGCPIKERKWKLYLRAGAGFAKLRRTTLTYSLLSLAISYRSLYASLTTKYYIQGGTGKKPGVGNSSLFIGYSHFLTKKLYTLPGVRVKIPTGAKQYSDGKVDISPSIVLDYLFNSFDVFLYTGYTLRGNKRLKNTLSLSGGIGKGITDDLYLSLSYDLYQSAYRSGYNKYVSIFTLYNINRHFYTTLSYSYGINKEATDHSATLRIGIRF